VLPPIVIGKSTALLACRSTALPRLQILNFGAHVWVVRVEIYGKNSILHHTYTPIDLQLLHYGNSESILSSNFHHACKWEETILRMLISVVL
jgi:hypothetical protein